MDASNLISRLEKWKVIPDVIDSFTPSVEAKIKYGSTPLLTGSALRKEGTQELPQISWVGANKEDLFTIVMVDPDAPSPEEPSMKEFLHWIVTNVPGSFSPTCQNFLEESTEVLPYMGPAPVSGNHRYIFVVYKQAGKVDLKPPSDRPKFSLRSFAKESQLGEPVYSDLFFCENVKLGIA